MISIVTPVLNEKENIGRFFENMNELEGDFELIMVDGQSSDGTPTEIERVKKGFNHPLTVISAPRGRSLQMNRGAEVAKGDILLFLHVDSKIQRDSLDALNGGISKDGIIGGAYTQSFENPDTFLKITSAFGNFRARATKIFFGDYGIFIKKEVFDEMGGYEEIPFLEDVELCKKAKKYGTLDQLDRDIITSARRYEKKGRIRLTAFFTMALFLNMVGLRPKFLYRYIIEM
jgi:rSAM/selenodomain-associated transferase 2